MAEDKMNGPANRLLIRFCLLISLVGVGIVAALAYVAIELSQANRRLDSMESLIKQMQAQSRSIDELHLKLKKYSVASVISHTPRSDNNSTATLRVYLIGNSGNMVDVICLFPPSFQLSKIGKRKLTEAQKYWKSDVVWGGIDSVRLTQKVRDKNLIMPASYFCEMD